MTTPTTAQDRRQGASCSAPTPAPPPPTHYYRQPLLHTPGFGANMEPEQPVNYTQGNSAAGGRLDEPRCNRIEDDFEAMPMTSPIRRLPPELLAEIFLHCLPGSQFVQPHPTDAPLLLTQVSSWWRSVCVSTPQLWASLELVYKVCEATSLLHDTKRNTEALIELWLSRSGDLPLSLSIQGDALLVKGIQCLLNSDAMSRRLQHLKVVIPRRTYTAFLPATRYPRLHSADLHTPFGLVETLLKDISTVLSNSPELQSFKWTNNSFISSPISVQWSTLSHLHLTTAISIQNCLYILEACTNAVSINIKDVYLDLLQPPSREIVLPRLAALTLSSRVNIMQVFECLTVPNLKALVVTLTSWHHELMMAFIHRSKFALENLDIFFPPMTDVEILQVLEKVQGSLTELTLQTDSATVTDMFLERMSIGPPASPPPSESSECSQSQAPRPTPFCPNLESIALYNCIACTPGGVARMVASRRPHTSSALSTGVAPLRIVETFDSEPELRSLVSLRRLGVDVVVYSEETGTVVSGDLTAGFESEVGGEEDVSGVDGGEQTFALSREGSAPGELVGVVE